MHYINIFGLMYLSHLAQIQILIVLEYKLQHIFDD